MGCVVSAGVGQAPARQAMRIAGMPDAVGATTVNKVCGSGMKAATLATDLIRAGSARCVVAGGMESMSNAPYLLAKARRGQRIGHGAVVDAMFLDGLEDAANASSISDGASALVLADQETAGGATPLARVVGHATHSIHPSEFTIAPIGAIEKLLKRVGWRKEEVDLFEINEAFAMVTMLAIRELGLDPARVNVHGGACAQGHPIGSTGSRLMVTLAHALHSQGGRRGVAALCIGGGEATAMALERV